MTAGGDITLDRRGKLLLFAVDHSVKTLRLLADPPVDPDRPYVTAVPALLGVDAADTRHVELFETRDLAGLGLPAYLASAYDIDEAALAPHHATLAALDGVALLVLSDALPLPAILRPVKALTLLAEFETPQAAVSPTPLRSTATAPKPTATPPAPLPPSKRRPTALILLALVLAAVLIWLGSLVWGNVAPLSTDTSPEHEIAQ
ncbi:hypothetical protein N4R57_03905 [Rhodobacteraceae bacterium D3-12]|nr:hypothetical protein N4R57_03905 [Rhodobacteraceae bacterium D3-12]